MPAHQVKRLVASSAWQRALDPVIGMTGYRREAG
jgi:hypothetical protein